MSDLQTPSSTGLAPNVAGALSYVLGPITGIVFLVLEKQNRFVRFHAMQSTLIGVALIVFNIVINVVQAILVRIPFIGWLFALGLAMVIGLASLVLWLALMYQAYVGKEWELPIVGEHARKFSDGGIAMQ
ncbi:hypothetical protein [Longimicrobium sp.]|uniref:DUF4870 domain-containing protein n=1 Tax=Longimicrobium sp. TaxID=2029185 RepID=UPI002E326654|nr:hypothetical protein [Longimicrobium sp.]HEX6041123.1 hypothetical protein [Longimicrobium sp.]